MIHLIRHRIQQSPVSANYFNKHKLRKNLHQSYSTIYICNSILTTICCLVLFSLANSQKKGFVHTLTRCKVYSVIHNHFRRHFWKHFWKHLRLNFKYLAIFVFFFPENSSVNKTHFNRNQVNAWSRPFLPLRANSQAKVKGKRSNTDQSFIIGDTGSVYNKSWRHSLWILIRCESMRLIQVA